MLFAKLISQRFSLNTIIAARYPVLSPIPWWIFTITKVIRMWSSHRLNRYNTDQNVCAENCCHKLHETRNFNGRLSIQALFLKTTVQSWWYWWRSLLYAFMYMYIWRCSLGHIPVKSRDTPCKVLHAKKKFIQIAKYPRVFSMLAKIISILRYYSNYKQTMSNHM